MYQITCDGLILHDVRLPKEYRVLEPECKLELNTAGSLTFKMAPGHPYYDRIQRLKSTITLTQDGEWIFSGRVLNDEKNFQNIKTIEVEGELSYLIDSNQRTAEYNNISVADYFSTVITKHNDMVEEDKQLTVGMVTVTDPNDSLYRFSNYENTWETIEDKLINRLGGYVRIRHAGDTKYIDYIENYENVNNQEINFGQNLLDMTEYVKGEDIITALIPLGAKLNEETDERLTIESVNEGLDYVHDEDAVALYGWVFGVEIWDNVTIAGNLLTKAQDRLSSRRLLSIRLELNAVDLHLLDVSIERIKLGDSIKVVSEPHGINQYMTVSSMTINLENPDKSAICLGQSITSLTKLTNNDGIDKKVEEILVDYGVRSDISAIRNEVRQVSSELSRTSENILLAVSEEYASKDEVSSVNEQLSTQLNIYSDRTELRFSTFQSEVDTINGVITANQNLLEEYIRFQGALIELGRIGNSFVARLSNEKLAFLQNNIEIAYISNNKLYITDAEVKNKLTIGNPVNGYFDFIPRANGNLSLKWRLS